MKTRLLFFAAACSLLYPWAGAAQVERGPLEGDVRDARNGAPLPGVQVMLRAVQAADDSPLATATTADDGRFVFPDLPAGTYVLTFSLRGFATAAKRFLHNPRAGSASAASPGADAKVHAELLRLSSARPPEHPRTAGEEVLPPPPTPQPTPAARPTPQPRIVVETPVLQGEPPPTQGRRPASPHAPRRKPPRGAGDGSFTSMSPPPVEGGAAGGEPVSASPPPAKIDEILAGMEFGQIAFNVPPSMSLKKTETITLLLSPKQAAAELEQRLRDEGAVGEFKQATIKIGDTMQAVLSGEGFQITRLTEETLPVSRLEPTQWKWDVRAERAGELKLHVVLNALVDLGDGAGARRYPIKTFDQSYRVKASWRDGVATFVAGNWKWLWVSALLPVAGWFWSRGSLKRRAALRRLFSSSKGGAIFISYRRADSAGHVGHLKDALVEQFGAERVFVDIDSIAYGDNFVKAVEHSLGLSAVAIIVIGPQWLSVTDKKGGRRLDDPKDFVRQEVALALGSGIKVIPALVEGASMPGEDVLPPPLAELALHNAIELSDSRWEFDVGRLLEALEAALAKGRHSPATEDA